MGDSNFRPPTESTPLDRSPKNLVQVITFAAPTAMPNLVQIRPWGLLGKWVKYNNFLIYTLFSGVMLPLVPLAAGLPAGQTPVFALLRRRF